MSLLSHEEAYPFVVALCPTWRKQHLLQNTLSCFLSQNYPIDRMKLIVFDDDDQYRSQDKKSWEIVSHKTRFPSLPAKYNALLNYAEKYSPDVVAVMEYDDVYLPNHIADIAREVGLKKQVWAKSKYVLSDYNLDPNTKRPLIERSAGRFHASIGFDYKTVKDAGGWIETDDPLFDQFFLKKLADLGPGSEYDCMPQYIFRWHTTETVHGQNLMARHKEDWYRKAAGVAPEKKIEILRAVYDATTAKYYRQYAGRQPVGDVLS